MSAPKLLPDERVCEKHGIRLEVETDCHVCHGSGEVEDMDDYGDDPGMVLCWSCKGTGAGLPDCEFCIDEYEAGYMRGQV